MAWKCPACRHVIRHSDYEDTPRPGAKYRCHICRLELIADLERARMIVAPWNELRPGERELPADTPANPPRRKKRA